jgi:hypothetical protein
MAEVVNSVFAIFTTDQVMQMVTNNMPFRDSSALFHSIQELAAWMHVPGVQKPSDWQMRGGLEDLYIAPVQTFKDIFGIGGDSAGGGGGSPSGMPSMKMPSMKMPSMKMPSMKF